ncbi:hypothetical protein GGR54DRAFT_642733 [Hypoxylon sp. NC1633]|nr:hypothetical protein GGR54DRAFT_642733 [Hypoxylon sp. NC1633]
MRGPIFDSTGRVLSTLVVSSTSRPSNRSILSTLSSTSPTLSSSSSSSSSSSADASCTSTPSSSIGSIENGDFEQGLSPWSIDLVDIMSTSYSVTRPGADGSCGAFHVAMRRNSQTDDLRSNLRLVSATVQLPASPGPEPVRWAVSFWVRWANRNDNSYLLLYANYAVAHRVDANSTEWTRVEFPYVTAGDGVDGDGDGFDGGRMLQLEFSFVLGDAAANEVWIDKVAMEVISTATTTATSTLTSAFTSTLTSTSVLALATPGSVVA